MSSTMHTQARRTAWISALLLVVLSLGVGGTAFADPGEGQGGGQDNGNGVISSAGDNGNGSVNANGGNSETAHADAGPAAASSSGSQKPTGTSAQGSSTTSSSKSQGATRSSSSQGKGATKSSATSSSKASHATGNASTQGSYQQPQPQSHADLNGGGANGQCTGGAYCSTRNGAPSLNGNGDGKAVGKPCAGCVGKADNKNPQGQRPNGSDHNAGYECDRNNGIGKTNPAHTGCRTPTTVVQTCPDGSPLPASGVCPTPPRLCPDGSPLPASGVCPTPPRLCPDGSVMPPNGKCDVAGEETVVPPLPDIAGVEDFAPRPKPNAEVLGVQATADAPAVLPATGSSAGMGLLTGAGFLLLAAGAALTMRRRLS